MDELKYGLLAEIYGRMEAELIKSYLEAHEIDVELFQESIGQNIWRLICVARQGLPCPCRNL